MTDRQVQQLEEAPAPAEPAPKPPVGLNVAERLEAERLVMRPDDEIEEVDEPTTRPKPKADLNLPW